MLFKSKLIRSFFFLLGWLCFAAGVLGIILPLLPATPFFLLAAWLFLNSSPKAHAWLYRQPYIGDSLRRWQETKSISKSNKFVAVSMILISIVFVSMRPMPDWIKFPLLVIMLCVCSFILTRPSN